MRLSSRPQRLLNAVFCQPIVLPLAFCAAFATVLAPALHATPAGITLSTAGKHNYGSVATGQSVAYGIKVTNNGSSAFAFSLSLTGASDFTEQNSCGSSIKAASSCEIVFTYAPPGGAKGIENAAWTIANPGSVPFSPSNSGSLLGTPAATQTLTLNTLKHNFLSEPVGGTTAQFGLIIQNSNNVDIGGSYDFGGDAENFDLNSNCEATIPAHSTCVIIVDFDPLSTGFKAMTLTITPSSGTVTPGSTVTFVGTGT